MINVLLGYVNAFGLWPAAENVLAGRAILLDENLLLFEQNNEE